MTDAVPASRDSGVLDLPLADIARAVRAGETDAATLAAEALDRIRERDPALNAVVRLDPAARPGRGHGLLAGVPYLLKDLGADALGLPLTRGSRLLATPPPPGDSTVVTRLRAAGVTLLGRTNTPELGLSITTEPVRYGPTRNPWDLSRSAGGSSGGSAAAVAAGMVPAAHATDSGGSTRIPAAWCGVVGFKPSRGAVPTGPWRRDDWQGLTHQHAITRTVADTRLIFEATRGPAPGEWQPCPELPPHSPGPLRVGLLLDTPSGTAADPHWRSAAVRCAHAVEELGHHVVPLPAAAPVGRIGATFGTVVAAHLAALADEVLEREGRPAGPDLVEPAVLELVERGRALTAADLVRAVTSLHEIGQALGAAWQEVDVVLSPTLAGPAPRIGEVTTQAPASVLFADVFRRSPFVAAFNVTGGPGLSLPWGLDPHGLPLGVHLGAAPGRDLTVLALAQALDDAQPGLTRLRPPAQP